MTLALRPYQLEGRDFLAGRRFALLADEMRVGKTPQAILAAHKLGAKTILVTCPAIAVAHWEREFVKWWPGETPPRVAIWSYDKARELWRNGLRGAIDVFIPDECHFAKNPDAARTRMVYGKTGFGQQAGAIWPLSGTPAPKHAAELWPMLCAFGVVKMKYDEFIRHFCTVEPMSLRVTGTKVAKIPELRSLLAPIMLRRMRKDVAPDMPGITYEFLTMAPPAHDAGAAVPPGLTDEQLVDWMASHQTHDRENRIAVAMAKVPQLVDEIVFAIENGLLKQTVVFGWHTDPLKALWQGLERRGIKAATIIGETTQHRRAGIQDDFKAGTLEVVIGNILAAGTAIDLSAADHAYFLELDWVSGNNVQAASRLVSMDKAVPVTVDVCTWPGSTDDRVQRVLLRRVRELSKLYR